MRMDWRVGKIEPDAFYGLMARHNLLPLHLGEELLIRDIRGKAETGAFGLVVEDAESDPGVLAATLTYGVEPGVLCFLWIPEVKALHRRKQELSDLGLSLRDYWFHELGARRVEARVPIHRTQSIRALKAIGFRQETLDCGIRDAVDHGNGLESVVVLGLLEADPVKVFEQKVEVVHG